MEHTDDTLFALAVKAVDEGTREGWIHSGRINHERFTMRLEADNEDGEPETVTLTMRDLWEAVDQPYQVVEDLQNTGPRGEGERYNWIAKAFNANAVGSDDDED